MGGGGGGNWSKFQYSFAEHTTLWFSWIIMNYRVAMPFYQNFQTSYYGDILRRWNINFWSDIFTWGIFWGIMKKSSSLFCLYSWNVNHPQYYVHVKMFYLTRWSTNICSIALTLLLIVVFWFLIFISTIYYSKEIVQFKYQTWLTFSWHCKSCNVFTIYETLFQNVINIYQ